MEVGLLHRSALLWAQVDHAKSLHYIGTGVAFPAGLLFVCLHCALSYHGATAPQDLAMAYLRIVLAAIAFVTLILSILPGQGSQELLLYPSLSPPKTQGVGVRWRVGESPAYIYPENTAQCSFLLPLPGGKTWLFAPA